MSPPKIPFAILGTASALPPRRLSTAQILQRTSMPTTAEELERLTGIHNRCWVEHLPACRPRWRG